MVEMEEIVNFKVKNDQIFDYILIKLLLFVKVKYKSLFLQKVLIFCNKP